MYITCITCIMGSADKTTGPYPPTHPHHVPNQPKRTHIKKIDWHVHVHVHHQVQCSPDTEQKKRPYIP